MSNQLIHAEDYYQTGLALHGHKCPAMPMGLRVGAAAMNALGVERARDGQLQALIEIGVNHCATCFADGVQMITGCTVGKGTIRRLHYGKWALTLIDKKTSRAVRVAVRAEMMAANKETDFFQQYRMKGVPASQVPSEVVTPLVERVMNAADEQLVSVGAIFECRVPEPPHSFESFVCASCGEMVAEPYGRLQGDKKVCIPCRRRATGQLDGSGIGDDPCGWS
jgi:formylmethanofuran dehydrogenase subunit E